MLTYTMTMLAAAAPAGDVPPPPSPPPPLVAASPAPMAPQSSYWQIVIDQQVIIRVPAQRSSLNNFTTSAAPPMRPFDAPQEWKEKKGPKCVAMRTIIGMQTAQRDSIDLITRQKQRLRAQLNRGCRALDFYAGFYMKDNKDGRLCAGRDELHARTGAKCEVDRFRLMVPVTRNDD